MRDYFTGLLLSCRRKSVEPIAAATAPAEASAQHQSLLHFMSKSAWSDAAVLGEVRSIRAAADRAAWGDRGMSRR